MYLDSQNSIECFGCEACAQICPKAAIEMKEDAEGFRYPHINPVLCIECSACHRVCPQAAMPLKHEKNKYVFGGYHRDDAVRFESTSGGAFSAIAESFCDENYVVFGAEAHGLEVRHQYIEDIKQLPKFRKSKYSQSVIGTAYQDAKAFLQQGKKVLFSGTPCQIAGLKNYLANAPQDRLLTVEVVCEGAPSPLFIRKMDAMMQKRYGSAIKDLDYRYTGRSLFKNGKWDFQQMKIELAENRKRSLIRDRWFNPFWFIWLDHLMSRPSCYHCPFTTTGRVADITLGDLWGVHLYCPELYGNNGGSSLVVCNTPTGKAVFRKAQPLMNGHLLAFEDALRYQSPMRKTISVNPNREAFMKDLQGNMSYEVLIKKWARKPTAKLLWQKYIWGNRQKIFFWKLKQFFERM